MKKWEKPELKNLALGETNTEEECVGEFEGQQDKSFIPDRIFKCTKWDSLKRCTHPKW